MHVRDYGQEPMDIDDNEMITDFEKTKEFCEQTIETINDCKLEVDFLTKCETRVRNGDRTTTFSPHFKFIHVKSPSTIRWYRTKMKNKQQRLRKELLHEIEKFHHKYQNTELYAELINFYIQLI